MLENVSVMSHSHMLVMGCDVLLTQSILSQTLIATTSLIFYHCVKCYHFDMFNDNAKIMQLTTCDQIILYDD